MVNDRILVAHLAKTFLTPTEIFIGAQLQCLERYQPTVYCQERLEHSVSWDLPVVSFSELLGPMANRIESLARKTVRMVTPWGGRKLEKELRSHPVRLVHCHYLTSALFFLRALRRVNIPKVVSGYGYDVSSFPLAPFGLALHQLQKVFRDFTAVIAMSNDMKQDLIRLGCPPEKIIVHYHGVYTGRFAFPARCYTQPQRVNILMSGRLAPKKGHIVVLKALSALVKKKNLPVPLHLVLVGDGPMRESLQEMVQAMGLQGLVVFKGHIPYHDPELQVQYQQADLFVHPSITWHGEKEGIPGTLAEAMAAGLPVISTRHAGIPEAIDSGRTGILVDEGDVEALADAMDHLIRDPGRRESLGKAAAAHAALYFDVQVQTKALEVIYDRLVNPG
jgi:colanic acid/amylovoran biosynthesis glycosyltransferase